MGSRASSTPRHRAVAPAKHKAVGSHRAAKRSGVLAPIAIAGTATPFVIGVGVIASSAAAIGPFSAGADNTARAQVNNVADVSVEVDAPRPNALSRSSSRFELAEPVTLAPKPPPKPKKPAAPSKPAWLRACGDTHPAAHFANGQIPVGALCPLREGRGELRTDAAEGFWKLDAAYQERFGEPVCVTDSYRSLSSQIYLARVKPSLAARPGTSNHGWGIALDLCGGVESFSSEQHEWFLGHAPSFGWALPDWARPGGSRPEPWHWEYQGVS